MSQDEKRYPFPPENSMYWSNPDLTTTYEESAALFDAQTTHDQMLMRNPTSEKIASTIGQHTRDYPFPPQHSMYWSSPEALMTYEEAVAAFDSQDLQAKAMNRNPVVSDVVENTPMGNNDRVDEAESEAEIRAIIPVRYAYDITQQSPKLEGNFRRGRLITDLPYTLRQIRDGYIYVFDEVTRVLDEYEVEGHQFKNTRTGQVKSCLEYPVENKIKLAYSSVEWTERVCALIESSASERGKYMRQLSKMSTAHTGAVECLSKLVADVGTPPEHNFLQTALPLEEYETDEGEELDFKAASVDSDWLKDVDDVETCTVIALDDPYADIQDLTQALQISTLELQLLIDDESPKGHKWQMAQITREIARVNVDEKDWPSTVDSKNYLIFERDLNAYLRAQKANQDHTGHSPLPYMDMMNAQKVLEETWQFKPRPTDVKKYSEIAHFHRHVNWDGLDEFSEELEAELAAVCETIAFRGDILAEAIQQLRDDMFILGLDIENKQGQERYSELIAPITALLGQAEQTEKSHLDLQSILNGKNLLALAPFGGSADLKAALDLQTVDNPLFSGASDVIAIVGNIANLESMFGDERVTDSDFYKSLSQPVKRVIEAMSAAVNGAAAGAWETLVMSITPKQLPKDPFLVQMHHLRTTVLESILSGVGVVINEGYDKELAKYHRDLDKAVKGVIDAITPKNAAMGLPYIVKHNRDLALAELRQVQSKVPQLIAYKVEATNEAARTAIFNKANDLANRGKSIASGGKQAYLAGGGTGALLASLNLFNIGLVSNQVKSLPEGTPQFEDAKKELFASYLWAVVAVSDVAVGQALDKINNQSGALGRTARMLKSSEKGLSRALFRFQVGTLIMSFAGAIASAIEIWRIFNKLKDSDDTITKTLYLIQAAAHIGHIVVFGAKFVATSLGLKIGIIAAAWMGPALLAIGLIILSTSMIINYLKKTPLERWLIRSCWGTRSDYSSSQEEVVKYELAVYRPDSTLEKIPEVRRNRHPSHNYDYAQVNYKRKVIVNMPDRVSEVSISTSSINDHQLLDMARLEDGRLMIELDSRLPSQIRLDLVYSANHVLLYHLSINNSKVDVIEGKLVSNDGKVNFSEFKNSVYNINWSV